jgi:hypothetical protein
MLALIPIVLLPAVVIGMSYYYSRSKNLHTKIAKITPLFENPPIKRCSSFAQDVAEGFVRIGNNRIFLLEKIAEMSPSEFFVWQQDVRWIMSENEMKEIRRARIWRKDPVFMASLIDEFA